jgi:hypothetical protein
MRLLLVEDNDDHADLLQRLFERHAPDVELVRARNGAEALAALRPPNGLRPPDIVLLDLKLPDISGVEVLTAVKTHHEFQRIPVVILSSSASPEDCAAAYARGANSYLVKPSRFADLKQLIETLVQYWRDFNRNPDDVDRADDARGVTGLKPTGN